MKKPNWKSSVIIFTKKYRLEIEILKKYNFWKSAENKSSKKLQFFIFYNEKLRLNKAACVAKVHINITHSGLHVHELILVKALGKSM